MDPNRIEPGKKWSVLQVAPSQVTVPIETKCEIIAGSDMRIIFDPSDPLNTSKVRCKSGPILQANSCDYWKLFGVKPGTQFYLIDQYDVHRMTKVFRKCNSQEEKDQQRDKLLSSVTEFSKDFKKNIYVRMIAPNTRNTEQMYRVFVEEALEIIPIVLRQQNDAVKDEVYNQLEACKRQMSSHIPDAYNTIDIGYFNQLLEQFGVDPSLITLVQDPLQELTRYIHLQSAGHIVTYTPNMELVTDSICGVNYVFMKLVMGVNWKLEVCPHHVGCKYQLRAAIVATMRALIGVPENYFVSALATIGSVDKIADRCPLKYQTYSPTMPDYSFKKYASNYIIKKEVYEQVADEFQLPKYRNFLPEENGETLPVWMTKMLLKLGWVEQFFSEKDETKYREVMVDCLMLAVPRSHETSTQEFLRRWKSDLDAAFDNSKTLGT